jgi:peptidyl-dipeptidase A
MCRSSRIAAALLMAGMAAPIAGSFNLVLAQARPASGPATLQEARTFLEAVEARLLAASVEAGRASWVQSTYITDDTEILAAQANERMIASAVEFAKKATRLMDFNFPST